MDHWRATAVLTETTTSETLTAELIELCLQYDVIKSNDFDEDEIAEIDMADSGLVDSLGIVLIKELLLKKYQVDIPSELFYAELRSLQSVSDYLAQRI